MTLNVPVGVLIFGIVLLIAAHFDLLEAPRWQCRGAGSKIAARVLVSQSHPSCQAVNPLKLVLAASDHVIDRFKDPIIVRVANCGVTIARHLVVQLRHWCDDRMRVQVATGRVVHKAND